MSKKAEAGLAVLAQVMGADYVHARHSSITEFNRPLRDFLDENCFGDVWMRPGLERTTRSLILISPLIALNRPTQLEAHLHSAITNRPPPPDERRGGERGVSKGRTR